MNAVKLTEDEQFFNVQQLSACSQQHQPQKTVRICRRWRQSQYPWSTSPLPLECRDVPPILLHPAYNDDTQVVLYLVKPLQAGPEQWSQTWEGSLHLDPASTQGHQPARVVTKLFQESQFPRSWDQSDFNSHTGPTYGSEHAKREAWAYNVLRSMQGKQLPWSYGMFLFELPNGGMTYGHVMEFIDGEQGGTVDLSVEEDPPESLRRLIDYIISALMTINQFGVAYNDVRKQNMLYRKTDARHPFVFIDFGSAPPAMSKIVAYDCFLGIDALRKMGVSYQALLYWHDESRKTAPAQTTQLLEYADNYVHADQPKWITQYRHC